MQFKSEDFWTGFSEKRRKRAKSSEKVYKKIKLLANEGRSEPIKGRIK